MQVQLQRMETHINILSFSAEMNESSEMPKNEIIRHVGGSLGIETMSRRVFDILR